VSNFRTPFVGVGTGRCGTTSLCQIVQACKNVTVGHEIYQLHFYGINSELGKMIKDFRTLAKRGILCGDVSQPTIKHIGNLRASFTDMPVVCMHRDKASTVASFVEYGTHYIRPQDKKKWADGSMGNNLRANAMKCFPLIDAISPEQAYGFYWEFYEALMEKVAPPVFHMEMDALNSDTQLSRLFDFLSIPESDRVYIEQRKFWAQEVVQEAKKERARGRLV